MDDFLLNIGIVVALIFMVLMGTIVALLYDMHENELEADRLAKTIMDLEREEDLKTGGDL